MRSTTYGGLLQLGPSAVIGEALGGLATRGSGNSKFVGALYLPDGLPYLRARLGVGYLVPHFWLTNVEQHAFLLGATAEFADDPRGDGHAWIRINLDLVGRTGTAVGYQVTALVPPDAVDQPG